MTTSTACTATTRSGWSSWPRSTRRRPAMLTTALPDGAEGDRRVRYGAHGPVGQPVGEQVQPHRLAAEPLRQVEARHLSPRRVGRVAEVEERVEVEEAHVRRV